MECRKKRENIQTEQLERAIRMEQKRSTTRNRNTNENRR
jgi:hypothetical protein